MSTACSHDYPGSTQKLVTQWPPLIDFIGFEIDCDIEYPEESIEEDFNYAGSSPYRGVRPKLLGAATKKPLLDFNAHLASGAADMRVF